MKSFLKNKKDKSGDGEDKMSDNKSSAKPSASTSQSSTQQHPEFAIQRIYLKSLNYESPTSPAVFSEEWKPVVDMQVQTTTNKIKEGLHEAILKVTLTSKSNDVVVLKVEVEQAGIFVINHFETEQLGAVLGGTCPNVLFPYAREVISDLASRGTFPLLYLAPINFDVAYAQALQRQKESAS